MKNSFTRLSPAALILSLFVTSAVPTLTMAQDGLSDVCEAETRNGNGWDNAALRPMIEGSWEMSATGTGRTQGTWVETVQIRYDLASRAFVAAGLRLKPLASLPADSPLRRVNIMDTVIDVTKNKDGPGNTVADVALLQGCTDTTQLPIYWWSRGSGDRKSWGMIMFMSSEIAVGYMSNSAFGSRTTVMVR